MTNAVCRWCATACRPAELNSYGGVCEDCHVSPLQASPLSDLSGFTQTELSELRAMPEASTPERAELPNSVRAGNAVRRRTRRTRLE